ncbi:hypothetical protein ABZ805_25470 [Saccharopolyspora sp. NPDC047091]|uniref:hypothetical protein n=1 Tax=Saccharopolyspora sp. NPDC047091 TaxID=3155924 RepID=UPI0033F08ADC
MARTRIGTTMLVVTAGALLSSPSSCAGGSGPSNPASAEPSAPEPGRRADQSVLGVADARECPVSVVQRASDAPVAEFTVHGLPGDTFSYRIEKVDGSVLTGTSGEFAPVQREAVFTTGVPNAEIRNVTISAHGRTGIAGTCRITSIS